MIGYAAKKAAPGTALVWLAATPALAEVCDKVRPGWTSQRGQISQFEDLFLFLAGPAGLLVVALTVVALIARRQWLSRLCSGMILGTAVLVVADWIWPDDITRLAIAEGCLIPPILKGGVLFLLAASIVAIQQRSSSKPGIVGDS